MSALLCVIAVVGVAWCLAYWRAPLLVWTAAAAAGLVAAFAYGAPSRLVAVATSVLFLAIALALNLPALRRVLLSAPLLGIFRRIMPAMSDTEREALEAGTVWWEAELFGGRPRWRKLFSIPAPRLAAEERAFLDGPVEELCRLIDDWRITHEFHDLPPEVWRFIKDKGFFGMIIPKKYGGLEFSAQAHSAVVTKVASRSVTAAVTVMVPNSLGPAELLLHYGTEEQKNYYLPRLARGAEVPCFALTNPEAGSDAGSMPDRGVACRGEFEGRKNVLGIRLNWEKRYITLGPVATVLGLAFRLFDPEHLLGANEDIGITLALIPTTTPGVKIGSRHNPLDIAFQNGPNWGKDVFIPMDWVIGGQQRIGQGWRMLMESLAAGRSISLPALSTGAGKLACRATGAYARIRKQFKLPIGRFEGVEEALARIAGFTYMMDAARTATAQAVDLGEKPSVASAIVKYHLTEHMRRVVNDAMDVQGGAGICLGPRNFMGRAYQALPISITVEGANILTRALIIRPRRGALPSVCAEGDAGGGRHRSRARPEGFRPGDLRPRRLHDLERRARAVARVDGRAPRARAGQGPGAALLPEAHAHLRRLRLHLRSGDAIARRRAQAQGKDLGPLRRRAELHVPGLDRDQALRGSGAAGGGRPAAALGVRLLPERGGEGAGGDSQELPQPVSGVAHGRTRVPHRAALPCAGGCHGSRRGEDPARAVGGARPADGRYFHNARSERRARAPGGRAAQGDRRRAAGEEAPDLRRGPSAAARGHRGAA